MYVYNYTLCILRSPELHAVKPGKPVVISSEFPCWQNEQGETKGGMMLFKMKPKKQRKTPAKEIKVITIIILALAIKF